MYPEEEGIMRILLYSCLITIALVCSPVIAVGDEHSHRKAAENLLIAMEVDKSLPKVVEQVVENQVQGGHDQRLYPRVHRARVEETDGVLQDPAGEESQRENAPACVHRRTTWSQESPGESSGATADARRPAKQTGWRRLTVLTPVRS
jgi:hypothetical protein